MTREKIFELINEEREWQAKKWGGWEKEGIELQVLVEEVGEVAMAMLKGDRGNLKDELVQVAAVAVAWLEGL